MSILRSAISLWTDPRFWGMNLLIGLTLLGGYWATQYTGAAYLIGWFLGFAYSELADWFIGRFGRPGGSR